MFQKQSCSDTRKCVIIEKVTNNFHLWEEKRMKKRLSILIALTLVVSLFLAACGGGGGGAEEGVYKATKMEMDGEDMIEMLEMMDASAYLVLEKGGSGYMDLMGDHSDIKWDAKNLTMEGETSPYSFSGGVLKVTEGKNIMEFTKLSDAEAKEYKDSQG